VGCLEYPEKILPDMATNSVTPLIQSGERSLGLDLLRGVAVLGVLARHEVLFRSPTWDVLFVRAGWAGVDLFFVLSGFLVSGLLFSEYKKRGSVSFRRFIFRRALRIYPPLAFLIILTVATHLALGPRGTFSGLKRYLLSDLLFLQSYVPGTWGHFWSLSVEEHFYILLPLVLYSLLRKRSDAANPFSSLPVMFLCVAAMCLFFRLLTRSLVPFTWQTHLMPTHLRIDSLFFGAILSYYFYFRPEWFETIRIFRWRVGLLGLALISPCFVIEQYDPWMYTYGYIFLYAGFGAIVISSLYWDVGDLWTPVRLPLKALAYLGTFSYSVYLWHVPVLELLKRLRVLNQPVWGLWFYYGLALVVGILFARLIEIPTLRLRDRFLKRNDAGSVSPAQLPMIPEGAIPGR
jgi:peptidoglycan/LPS O-acetylase OafA/YrhL